MLKQNAFGELQESTSSASTLPAHLSHLANGREGGLIRLIHNPKSISAFRKANPKAAATIDAMVLAAASEAAIDNGIDESEVGRSLALRNVTAAMVGPFVKARYIAYVNARKAEAEANKTTESTKVVSK